MSILLADIDATCSNLGYHDGDRYYIEDDALQSLKHLIWILRRDNLDTHEYRRYLGHMKVVKTDLLPMLVHYCNSVDLSDVLLRLLVNLTNPPILFFRADLPKDNAGRRTYLDMLEISHSYKEAFGAAGSVWKALASRLKMLLTIDVADRMEEQNLIIERILVLTRNVLQVPANPQFEKRVDNDISVHDQVLLALHESGMFELILHVLASRYETQFYLHALEITHLVFRDQNVEMLAKASLERSEAEKHADEQALLSARRIEKAKLLQSLPPARHSRFGGTYVFKNMKSISDKDLICHRPLERVVSNDLSRDKKKIKPNFRLAKDEDKYERQSAFKIRLVLRELCLQLLDTAFNNAIRQVRRALDRGNNSEGSGHDQSYLLWAIRFFLQFNRLNGFRFEPVSEALSTGTIHWICNQIQHDADMVQSDKRMKINWNRRLQLCIQAYREFLENLPVLEAQEDDEAKALVVRLKSNVFYVVEYREIVVQLLLSYNENNFTRMYLRDLIDTANVYFKLMEKFCERSIVVQAKVKRSDVKNNKSKKNKKKSEKAEKKKKTPEEILAKLEEEWTTKMASNLSVVLANEELTLVDEELPKVEQDVELSIAEQCKSNADQLLTFLQDEEFEKAVILLRECRKLWPGEIFGYEKAQPEDDLLTLKNLFVSAENGKENEEDFWKTFNSDGEDEENGEKENDEGEGNESYDEEEEEEEETVMKEVVMNFQDIEKRLLNPKIIRACTFVLQSWEKMSYRELKSAVTILYRIAVNQKNPVMLMQAQLFQIFRQALNAPADARYEELRKLATYIVKHFVKIARKNPKVYAELLFFKSHRECYEIEYGYNDHYGGEETSKKNSWSEAQEELLRSLFMQNQESPQTDQDVIDWLVERLEDKTKNRRNVIKKLKELGLIFKAPTKRSTAAAVNRNLFIRDEDEKLRELYDEHRLEDDCFEKIMEVFRKKRSKKAVASRMVQLGLIADTSEILPAKKLPRSREEEGYRSASQSESESDDDERPQNRQVHANGSNFSFSVAASQRLRNEVEESLREALEWIIESLREAAEDFEEVSEELSDAVPLVPVTEAQRSALENSQFVQLLRSISLIEPSGAETYWKIPPNMLPNELEERAKMLSGEVVEKAATVHASRPADSEDEANEDDDIFSRLRAQHKALAYNNSDNEERTSVRPAAKKLNTREAKKLLKQLASEHGDELAWLKEVVEARMTKKSANGGLIVAASEQQTAFLRNEIAGRFLSALSFEGPESGDGSHWSIPESLKVGDLKKRLKILSGETSERKKKSSFESSDEEAEISEKNQERSRRRLVSDSEDSAEEKFAAKNSKRSQKTKKISKTTRNSSDSNDAAPKRRRKASTSSEASSKASSSQKSRKSTQNSSKFATIEESPANEDSVTLSNRKIATDSDSEEESMVIKRKRRVNAEDSSMNTQELRQQLAELGESSEDEGRRVTTKRKVIESSDDESEREKSDRRDSREKRARSQSPNENEMNAGNGIRKMAKVRRIVDSDDDDL